MAIHSFQAGHIVHWMEPNGVVTTGTVMVGNPDHPTITIVVHGTGVSQDVHHSTVAPITGPPARRV